MNNISNNDLKIADERNISIHFLGRIHCKVHEAMQSACAGLASGFVARTTAMAAIVGFLAVAMPVDNLALAGPVAVADLNSISSSSIGTGTLGTVTLTQTNANTVHVTVALIDDTDFVNTGGPHTPFAFQLDVAPDSVAITSPLGGVFFPNYTGGSNTPYGNFNYAVDYSGGNGGGHGNHGPLDFDVSRAAGINLVNFVANGSGFFFSADVIGPAGGTGSIAASRLTLVNVPEPATLALLGVGVVALGITRRRSAIA